MARATGRGESESTKINFTKKEYQALVEMLLAADWVIRSHEEEPRAATKPYDDLWKKMLSHHKAMGMEDAFEYVVPDEGEYFETRDYEERAPHTGFIDAYDERMFWSLLASKLASWDLAADEALSAAERSMMSSDPSGSSRSSLATRMSLPRAVSSPCGLPRRRKGFTEPDHGR